jgi:hypothetical protein
MCQGGVWVFRSVKIQISCRVLTSMAAVMLERIYPKYGVHVNAYPLRGMFPFSSGN